MSEQEGPRSAGTEDVSGSTGTKLLSGLNALGWSAGAAVLTALATCAGMIRDSGRSSALALYSLSRPAVDQRDTYRGMNCLLSVVLVSVVGLFCRVLYVSHGQMGAPENCAIRVDR
jgi:hypothetical protein